VIGGGIALTLNPEPLADFFDVFVLGEAEEILPQFARVFAEVRRLDLGRKALLIDLQKQILGIYVPSLYAVSYFPEGKIKDVVPLEKEWPGRIHIAPVKNINAFCTTEVVSSADAEMADMFLVEVNRGCPHLCRFCAAGFVYAPPRFRSYAEIVSAVDRGLMIKKKIGLVGTAVSDHPDLIKICRYIVDRGAQAGIGSLRLDRMDEKIVDMLKAGGIETVTLAPEAGSQRLRDLLRKGITADDILNASKLLIEKEMSNLRLYFMVGLPSEAEEDIDAIIDLVKKSSTRHLPIPGGNENFVASR